MITESALQPILSAIFLLAGAAAYVPMIIIGWLPVLSRMPVLKHILEGVWGLFYCVVFIGVSHLAYDGRIKYFTVLCYIAGAELSAAVLKMPIEKLARKLADKRKKRLERESARTGD